MTTAKKPPSRTLSQTRKDEAAAAEQKPSKLMYDRLNWRILAEYQFPTDNYIARKKHIRDVELDEEILAGTLVVPPDVVVANGIKEWKEKLAKERADSDYAHYSDRRDEAQKQMHEAYNEELNSIVRRLPPKFASFVSSQAWERGHSAGLGEVLNYARGMAPDLGELLEPLLKLIPPTFASDACITLGSIRESLGYNADGKRPEEAPQEQGGDGVRQG